MPIDIHAHYLPAELVEALRRRQTDPRIETLPDGAERLHMPIGALPFGPAYFDMEARIASMDELGVGCQVLSLPGLFGVDSLPLADAEPLVRLFNDDLAGLCRRHPERFLGLAALPLADIDAAVSELRRARRELGFAGAILPVNGFLGVAEAQRLRPLFDAGQELGAHFFIHPGYRADEIPISAALAAGVASLDAPMPRRAIDVQTDLASAMTTLLFSDFLDGHSEVSVHVANLGGTLPMVIERMDQATRLRAPDDPLPSTRARRVTVDCASLGPRALEIAVAVYGADKIVLGTDCPIFSTEESLEAIGAARIGDADREAILHGNAERLLGVFARPPQAAVEGNTNGPKGRPSTSAI